MTTSHGRSSLSALGLVSDWSLWPRWRPLTLHGIGQSTTWRWAACSDDCKVPWAAIALPRPCQSMAWSGGIWIIYNVLPTLTNECLQSGFTDYALSVAHNTGRTQANIANFSCSLNLHISMCSRRSLNGLILSANTWFHPSCYSTKIASPVPLCDSPFYVHSQLLCHEHYLSVYGSTK